MKQKKREKFGKVSQSFNNGAPGSGCKKKSLQNLSKTWTFMPVTSNSRATSSLRIVCLVPTFFFFFISGVLPRVLELHFGQTSRIQIEKTRGERGDEKEEEEEEELEQEQEEERSHWKWVGLAVTGDAISKQ